MTANYHTHTLRCRHADGTEEDYVRTAIGEGYEILGFADHSPQIFRYRKEYSGFRMYPEELEGYVSTLSGLREKYADSLRIRIGLEAEYYPYTFSELMESFARAGVEYLIMGQHFIGEEEVYSGSGIDDPVRDEERLHRYTEQVLEGLRTGYFLYLAHPDVIRFDGDDDTYRRYMLPFCQELVKLDIPVEVNFLGISGHRHYPSERFFRIAKEAGCRVVFGVDAHNAQALALRETEAEARAFCARLGIVPEEKLDIVSPF